MAEKTVLHDTFVLERHYPAAVERVYAAFADPAKKRRWFAESAHSQLEFCEMDFRVGGMERVRLKLLENSPVPGAICESTTYCLEIQPERRLVYASSMSFQGRTISASLVTFELFANGAGTDLVLTHQAAFFEGADGPAMRREGWGKLLASLAEVLAN